MLPIASTRLFGMMLMKASMPGRLLAPALTISAARPADSASIWSATARSTPAPGCSKFTTARLTATAIAETTTV